MPHDLATAFVHKPNLHAVSWPHLPTAKMRVRRFAPDNRFLCLAKPVEVSHFRGCGTTTTIHSEVDSSQPFPIAVTKVLGSRSFLR
jgi:hypothetical protein